MTVGAYILIQTGVGRASDVAAQMRRLPGVSSVDTVAGPYDVIARGWRRSIRAVPDGARGHVAARGVPHGVLGAIAGACFGAQIGAPSTSPSVLGI
jgi:hypothetical protein